MHPTVAIILVNWNSFDVTNDCIHTLHQLSYPYHSIIVVDNGSADGSGARLQQVHPDIILLTSDTNLGFTGGNNLGLRYSLQHDFTYSILLNNDTFVTPDFLTNFVTYMNENPQSGVVQPKIFFHHDRSLIWDAGSYFNAFLGRTYTVGLNQTDRPAFNTQKQVDWITGCAFFVRNSVLQEAGILAENLFIYYEDVDLSFRIRKLGYQLIYEPASVIYHIAGMSNKSKTKGPEGFVSPVVHYLNLRNRIWVLKKYTPWYCIPSVLVFNFFYIIMVIGYFAARARFKKLKSACRGVYDGLTGVIKYNR